ncbi:hypothetical protein [Cognaticolwellia beringensis]|uniref:Uncharacterized protein n=1 Tax=Cognaticolwellia beringensis TaxID=1967665 RepID=A0A222GD11_9GAMM|nr:hypothetical protein [Cognaticolwellia beringensis]ASP49758.1 hypothetical protein B5D82_19470 [Cognaticolwellia beringensis]
MGYGHYVNILSHLKSAGSAGVMQQGGYVALSTQGIAHQIVSSLMTYRIDNLGTVNDCKVVINHLIRKFSEPLTKEGLQQIYYSKNLTDQTSAIKEHLFPVNEVMNHFLTMSLTISKVDLASLVHDYLVNALVIVYVTKNEDNKLNKCGYQKSMPEDYYNPKSPLYRDIWARYKSSDIYSNIEIEVAA